MLTELHLIIATSADQNDSYCICSYYCRDEVQNRGTRISINGINDPFPLIVWPNGV